MLDRTTEAAATAEIILEAGDLNDALRRVRHAMSQEETRYYLNGVYLHFALRDDVLRFVATDGHRLATADIPAPQGAINIRPVILSRTFVIDAIKATNKTRDARKRVRLAAGPDSATLTDWEGSVIKGALVDGTFPDYERVIPRGEPKHGAAGPRAVHASRCRGDGIRQSIGGEMARCPHIAVRLCRREADSFRSD
jgi:DNA polymerase-3 subunit beta